MDDLLQEFIAETREMLAAISGEIVEWEADPADRSRLDEIFRFVHTVKGSCGFLDLPRLARLSHAAEDVLGELRAGSRVPDAALVSAVLDIVDRIGELVEAIDTGESLSDEDDQRLIAALSVAPAAGPVTLGTEARPSVTRREPVARTVARTVRLPVELLDRMMVGVSDMVLARNELARTLRERTRGAGSEIAFERLSTCVAEMRDAITRTRMQRIDNIFATLPRLVRDLSAELGKLVLLEIDGGDVELDREMIEMIRDPLTHIIRNSIDHGIEAPDERRAGGKPPAGRLAVAARQAGNQILIEVADDGRGIDGEKVAARAVSAGLIAPERAAGLPWAQKVALIFEPGLSTAEVVTTISGRGVGMDVVRANVERIGGLVDLDSRPRVGLRVTMRVPLTLTIIPALTVSAGPFRFAIPRAVIDEIVRGAGPHVRIERIGGGEMTTIRNRRLPVVRLASLLGIAGTADEVAILMVLRLAGGAVYALALDAVHDHEELVVKPAAPAVMASGFYAGTTLPDSGRPMLLLDPAGIAAAAGVEAIEGEAGTPETALAETVPTLLFHDLDGAERGIRLGQIERIDEVPAGMIRRTAGRWRLVQNGRIVPLLGCRPPVENAPATVLRLCDGTTALGYAIASVIDIRPLAAAMEPAAEAGPLAGVVLLDGRQIELLDPCWLFAEAAGSAAPVLARAAPRPLALLGDPADPWTREVLRPLVEAAGYRVGFVGETAQADIVIDTGAPRGTAAAPTAASVIRLRATPEPDSDPDSIYRHDRAALLTALRGGAHAARR